MAAFAINSVMRPATVTRYLLTRPFQVAAVRGAKIQLPEQPQPITGDFRRPVQYTVRPAPERYWRAMPASNGIYIAFQAIQANESTQPIVY